MVHFNSVQHFGMKLFYEKPQQKQFVKKDNHHQLTIGRLFHLLLQKNMVYGLEVQQIQKL